MGDYFFGFIGNMKGEALGGCIWGRDSCNKWHMRHSNEGLGGSYNVNIFSNN